MSEDIKSLIEKIQTEGIKAAEDKAAGIQDDARKEAGRILLQAKTQAATLISEAEEKISRMEEKQKTLLAQAGRDMLLVLRKEINALLGKIISQHAEKALTPEALAKIISGLIKEAGAKKEGQIVIYLKEEDVGPLAKHLFHLLGEEAKKGIHIKASGDIHAGFVISYDAGKSLWDFSDKALAEYIGSSLKPKLDEILQASFLENK